MIASIELIKTAANIGTIKRLSHFKRWFPVSWLFVLLLAAGAGGACRSSGPQYRSLDYTSVEKDFSFTLYASSFKKKDQKLALLVPSPYSRLDYDNNLLVQHLRKKGYAIAIAATAEKYPLLTKKKWSVATYDALLRAQADSALPPSPETLVIIAFEDGAYLLPELNRYLKPDFFIGINAGAYSPLHEMLNALADTALEITPLLHLYDAIDREEMDQKVRLILKDPHRQAYLGQRSNAYWLSFYKDPIQNDWLTNLRPGHLIISRQYPLLSPSSLERLTLVLPKEESRRIGLTLLPGSGDFSKEQEMEGLVEIVKALLTKLP